MKLTCLSCRHQVLGGTQLGLSTLFSVAFDCVVAGIEERVVKKMFSVEMLHHYVYIMIPAALQPTYNRK